MKKGGGRHTGKIRQGTMHLKSVGGKDPHAHSSHHASNKKFGMPHGFAPPEGGGEMASGPPQGATPTMGEEQEGGGGGCSQCGGEGCPACE